MKKLLITILLLSILIATATTVFANKSQGRITLNDYIKVEMGMSYYAVLNIVDYSGQQISHSYIQGVPGVMDSIDTSAYQWINSDGSNMMIMFQNNKVISKAQYGLK